MTDHRQWAQAAVQHCRNCSNRLREVQNRNTRPEIELGIWVCYTRIAMSAIDFKGHHFRSFYWIDNKWHRRGITWRAIEVQSVIPPVRWIRNAHIKRRQITILINRVKNQFTRSGICIENVIESLFGCSAHSTPIRSLADSAINKMELVFGFAILLLFIFDDPIVWTIFSQKKYLQFKCQSPNHALTYRVSHLETRNYNNNKRQQQQPLPLFVISLFTCRYSHFIWHSFFPLLLRRIRAEEGRVTFFSRPLFMYIAVALFFFVLNPILIYVILFLRRTIQIF